MFQRTAAICSVIVLASFAHPALAQVGHVHQLYFNSGNTTWTDTDVTTLTNTPSVQANSGLAADVGTSAAYGVFYQAASNDVYFLLNASGWLSSDETAGCGGRKTPTAGSPLATNSFDLLAYIAANRHVHYIYLPLCYDVDL